MNLAELTRAIGKISTVNGADIRAVLYALVDVAADNLANGTIVRLGDLGIIRVTLSSEGRNTAEEVYSFLRFYPQVSVLKTVNTESPEGPRSVPKRYAFGTLGTLGTIRYICHCHQKYRRYFYTWRKNQGDVQKRQIPEGLGEKNPLLWQFFFPQQGILFSTLGKCIFHT